MAEEEVARFVVVTKVACARLLLLVTHVAAVPSAPEVEPAASIDSAPENSPGPDTSRTFKFTAFFGVRRPARISEWACGRRSQRAQGENSYFEAQHRDGSWEANPGDS